LNIGNAIMGTAESVYQGSGKRMMGEWSYRQSNTGQNVGHSLKFWDGATNIGASTPSNRGMELEIHIMTGGTSTPGSYCVYHYTINTDWNASSLSHIRGNSGQSGNRPYITMNGMVPQWKMNHTSAYTVDVFIKATIEPGYEL